MASSTPEQHEIILTRWYEELWNKRNYGVTQMLASADYVDHGDGSQDASVGPEGAAETVKAWHAAFPDGRLTLEDITTEDDLSVVRTTFRGTFSESIGDLPPSGEKVTVTSIGIERIVDGKIVERWGDRNLVALMQQIGALPALA